MYQTRGLGVRVNPNKGCERFIDFSVDVSDDGLTLDERRLGRAGRRAILANAGDKAYRAVKGRARISWKSDDHRMRCIAEQTRRGRWQDVLDSSARMRNGEYPSSGPVFIHPSLATSHDGMLIPVDGARRLMGYLEAGHHEVGVIVLVPATGS